MINNKDIFFTIFISIVLEALPFIILGSFIAAIIQIYVSEDTIKKIIPKNRFLGTIIAALLGVIFPLCECATVPITRGLIKKGVPLNIAITFMLAAPIVNPIVLTSTYYAFKDMPYMAMLRGGIGFLVAIIIGLLIDDLINKEKVIKDNGTSDFCSCGCNDYIFYNNSKISNILNHCSAELRNIGGMLIIGALISAAFQSSIPRNYLLMVGKNNILSIIAMGAFAFIISLCSEADAFIASSFINQFSLGSIVVFLILGPMIDMKNVFMLSSGFKKGFIIKLLLLIFAVCFVSGCLINIFSAGGMI
jgi:uncharacterized membrane protein YraQ (UPF0718 family)